MSEEFGQEHAAEGEVQALGAEAAHDDAAAPVVGTTGHPGVDRVLASMDGLLDLPGADQVTVYESAHEALRAALADAGS